VARRSHLHKDRFGDYCCDRFGSNAALEGVFKMVCESFDGSFAIGTIFVGKWNTIHIACERLESRL